MNRRFLPVAGMLMAMLLTAASAKNLIITTPVPTPVAGANPAVIAGPVVNPANGHTYYLLTPANWTQSEAAAVALGGHLVTVNDATEQKWLVETFGPEIDFSPHSYWIGLRQKEDGTYVWASGEPVNYTCWQATEPNSPGTAYGEFAFIGRYADGSWNDTNDENKGPPEGLDFGPLPRGMVEVTPVSPKTTHCN